MMLWNSMLAFVVNVDHQNKSPEGEKDAISMTTCYVKFLYLGYIEENVSYVLFGCDFKFVLLFYFFSFQHCVCVYVCMYSWGSPLWVWNKIKSNNTEKPMGKNWFINEKVAFISVLLLET